MLSILLTTAQAGFLPSVPVKEGTRICFDLEKWNWNPFGEWWSGDDEHREDTSCKICAYTGKRGDPSIIGRRHGCMRGIDNTSGFHNTRGQCLKLGQWDKEEFEIVGKEDVYVTTDCDDAAWIDRFVIIDTQPDGWERVTEIGMNNDRGWCLSTDRNDWKGWDRDGQYVPAKTCLSHLRIDPVKRAVYDDSHNSIWNFMRRPTYIATAKGASECPSGYMKISRNAVGWNQCQDAAKELKIHVDQSPGRPTQTGNWHWVPSGCSWQIGGDHAIHFNYHTNGRNDGKYSMICKLRRDTHVEENAKNVGSWGGECTCPDGSTYWVGDNRDACGSLACVYGKSGKCNKHGGKWSHRKVTCKPVGPDNGRRLAMFNTTDA